MRSSFLSFWLLGLGTILLRLGESKPAQVQQQSPLLDDNPVSKLQGKFLHITDFHPDPFYKPHTSTSESSACHRGEGSAGYYGAETSDCDSPFALINETFKWISENLKDDVDFVVWTGDSSRHDSDEHIPRTAAEVLSTNTYMAARFAETFGNGLDLTDHDHKMMVPVVPTFGNNDMLPHNIFYPGPNKWLKSYINVWNKFIPEEQHHGFERGGWFYVEAIPKKLAVFSLNTLYFFSHNAAVDGCAAKTEPGFEQMEWLRIQLQFMRDRGMKAILIGHVPPARTDSKELWDESCWQKYTLYLQQFRDVVVAGLYGHMNIDHFMLQDTKELNLLSLQGQPTPANLAHAQLDDEFGINSATEYLEELRKDWSDLPKIPAILLGQSSEDEAIFDDGKGVDPEKKKGKKSRKDKYQKKIGGPWGERFQVSYVAPSVVPNYFPTLRIFEYNITGIEDNAIWADQGAKEVISTEEEEIMEELVRLSDRVDSLVEELHIKTEDLEALGKKKKGDKKRKKKKPKNPDLVVPSPPTKGSPPGPAYSPQTLTLLGYSQYFANITRINNDIASEEDIEDGDDVIYADRWRQGKHKDKKPKTKKPHPKTFEFEIEYDTFSDKIFKLRDLTVTSYLRLAHRMGQYKPEKGDSLRFDDESEDADDGVHELGDVDENGKKGKKHKKKKKQHEKNKVWLAFIKRAFVSTAEAKDLLKNLLLSPEDQTTAATNQEQELHDDGEL